jgi:cytochrome c553
MKTRYLQLLRGLALLALPACAVAQRGTGPAGPPVAVERPNYEAKGDFDYLNTCAVCHGRVERAPTLETLQSLSPQKIYETITTGSMKDQAAKLTNEQKVKIAEFLSGRTLGIGEVGDAKSMSNR